MDDSFGHWLAGFADGEGCFTISAVRVRGGNPKLRRWPNCNFQIGLRADDLPVLEMIHATLGMGTIRPKSKPQETRPREMPTVQFTVCRIQDCVRVVEFFQRYPLRGKKAAQFDVWADAVHEMAKGKERSEAVLDACRDRLTALRQYVPPNWARQSLHRDDEPFRHRREYGDPPLCVCGCGSPTKLLTHVDGVSFPNPANPNYCSYRRGHHRRKQAS